MVLFLGLDCSARDNHDFGQIVELAEKQSQALDKLLKKIRSQILPTDAMHDVVTYRISMMENALLDSFDVIRNDYDEKAVNTFINCASSIADSLNQSINKSGLLTIANLEKNFSSNASIASTHWESLERIGKKIHDLERCVDQEPCLFVKCLSCVGDIAHTYYLDEIIKRTLPYAAAFTYLVYVKTEKEINSYNMPWLTNFKTLIGGVKCKSYALRNNPDKEFEENLIEQISVLGPKKLKFGSGIISNATGHLKGLVKIDIKSPLIKFSPMTFLFPFIKRDAEDIACFVKKCVAKKEAGVHCVGECHFSDKKILSYAQRLELIKNLSKNSSLDEAMCDYVAGSTAGVTELEMYKLFNESVVLAQKAQEHFCCDHLEKVINSAVRKISSDQNNMPVEDLCMLAAACSGEVIAQTVIGNNKITWAGIDNNSYKLFIYNERDMQPMQTKEMLLARCKIACAAPLAQELIVNTISFELVQKSKQAAFDYAFMIACDGAPVNSLTKKVKEEKIEAAWEIVNACNEEMKTCLEQHADMLQQLSSEIIRNGFIKQLKSL